MQSTETKLEKQKHFFSKLLTMGVQKQPLEIKVKSNAHLSHCHAINNFWFL